MFAPVTLGLERWPAAQCFPRHRHRAAYACLILEGGFEEAGDRGHFRMSAGDVVLHRPFEAHLDRFSVRGARAINFRLEGWSGHEADRAVAPDPDLIARLAERDVAEAREALLATMVAQADGGTHDYSDELARSIRQDPLTGVSEWASRHKLPLTSVSRSFRRVYQVSPNTFRAELRARHAWRSIMSRQASFAAIALDSGFADQAHMTRSVRALTGHTPGEWRRLVTSRFKTPL
jgi:AraC-like DNA-binding protein